MNEKEKQKRRKEKKKDRKKDRKKNEERGKMTKGEEEVDFHVNLTHSEVRS
jgi:hypothetical protein